MNHHGFYHVLITVLCTALFSVAQPSTPKASQVQARLQRAEAALRSNDLQTATREFRAVLSLDPLNVEANTNLGVIAFSQGDCRSASKDFRKALAVQPSLIKAAALLGICEKRLGDPSAQKLLETSFAKLTEPKLRTQIGLELAEIYEQNGDAEQTASVMGTLVGMNPENPDILYFAQRAYSELSDDTLNKLAIVAPQSARMQQLIAERLVNAGDLKGAIEHYKKTLEINPRLPGVHYELAEAVFELSPASADSQSEAEKELQTAIANEGDSSRIESELGRIAYARSDPDQAYLHYSKALSLNPGDVSAQMGLARVLMAQGKPEEAIKYLRTAVSADPLNGEAHYRLGTAYRTLQMIDEAHKELKLFDEIKKTKDQVKQLYREMNREPKPDPDEASIPAN